MALLILGLAILVPVGDEETAAAAAKSDIAIPGEAQHKGELLVSKDPRVRARAGFVPDRTEIVFGDDLGITFYVKNVGNKRFHLATGGDYRGGRPGRFSISAVDGDGNKVEDPHPNWGHGGGILGSAGIDPGRRYTERLSLHTWCKFEKPGVYTVTCKRTLNLSGESKTFDRPIATDFTITLITPTPEQARAMIEHLKQIKGKADFSILSHPVYLSVLLEYAQKGDADALKGIGGIRTPEATKALIGLAEQSVKDGKLDFALPALGQIILPDPRYYRDKKGSAHQLRLLERTWQQEFAEPLRHIARRLVHNTDQGSLQKAGYILECVGTAEDMPDTMIGYTNAIEATKTLPFETHQYFRPRGASYRYRFTTRQLIKRGGKVPDKPETPGAAAAYLIAMQMNKEFRPADWPEHAVRWLRYETPYMREFVLDHMPEPIPDAALDMLPQLLADDYVDLQIAACHIARKHPRETFREHLLLILKTAPEGKFGALLNAAAKAGPPNGITKDKIMEVWVSRMDNSDLGTKAVTRLLLTVLDDNQRNAPKKLSPEATVAAKARWSRFIEEHREKLCDGHRFKIGDPEIARDLFPPGFTFHFQGKAWPPDNRP